MNISAKTIEVQVSWPKNVLGAGCQIDAFINDNIELYAYLPDLKGKAQNWHFWHNGKQLPAKGKLFNKCRSAVQRALFVRGYRI